MGLRAGGAVEGRAGERRSGAMMDYMREGGFGMWLMLAAAVATFVTAALRPREARPGIFVVGCIASLVLGMLGLSTGLVAVANHYHRFPEPLAALATGLRELSHNGTFAALLAMAQGLAALITGRAVAKG
jgi:uncharacterized membrane protein